MLSQAQNLELADCLLAVEQIRLALISVQAEHSKAVEIQILQVAIEAVIAALETLNSWLGISGSGNTKICMSN